jgi:hypothetical protein
MTHRADGKQRPRPDGLGPVKGGQTPTAKVPPPTPVEKGRTPTPKVPPPKQKK